MLSLIIKFNGTNANVIGSQKINRLLEMKSIRSISCTKYIFLPEKLCWRRRKMKASESIFKELKLRRRLIKSHNEAKVTSPDEYCDGFLCEQSGLTEIRIAQIVNRENQIRNQYALDNNISNMFAVSWSPRYAYFARTKVMLCLPPTTVEEVIFESEIFEKWNSPKIHVPLCLEILIGQRSIPMGPNDDSYTIIDKAEDIIIEFFEQERFSRPTLLRRRGSTLQMGCDYLVRNYRSYIIMHLVCAYGILYFSDGRSSDYAPQKGAACSNCTFYYKRPFFEYGKYVSPIWGCMHKFPYLCEDLSNEHVVFGNFKYNCSKEMNISDTATDIYHWVTAADNPEMTIKPVEQTYSRPCFVYLIPILTIITIVFLCLFYQIYTILKLLRKKS